MKNLDFSKILFESPLDNFKIEDPLKRGQNLMTLPLKHLELAQIMNLIQKNIFFVNF